MPAKDAKPPIEEPDVIVCWLRIGFGTSVIVERNLLYSVKE